MHFVTSTAVFVHVKLYIMFTRDKHFAMVCYRHPME